MGIGCSQAHEPLNATMPRRRGYRSLPREQSVFGEFASSRCHKLRCMRSSVVTDSKEGTEDAADRSAPKMAVTKQMVELSQRRNIEAHQKRQPEETSTPTAVFDVTVETIETSLHSSFEHGGESLIGSVLVIENNNDECMMERELGDPLQYTYSAESGTSTEAAGSSCTPSTGQEIQWQAPGNTTTTTRRDDVPLTAIFPGYDDVLWPGRTPRSKSLTKTLPVDVCHHRSPSRSRHTRTRSSISTVVPAISDHLEPLISELCRDPSIPPPRIFDLAQNPSPDAPRIQTLFHNHEVNLKASRTSTAERKRHERFSDTSTSATVTTASNSSSSFMISSGDGSTYSTGRSLSSPSLW